MTDSLWGNILRDLMPFGLLLEGLLRSKVVRVQKIVSVMQT